MHLLTTGLILASQEEGLHRFAFLLAWRDGLPGCTCPLPGRMPIALALAMIASGCGNAQNYAGGCGSLPEGWITPRQGRGVLSGLSITAVGANGAISLNGSRVSEPELLMRLEQMAELNPVPVNQTIFDPSLDCTKVQEIRRQIDKSFNCRENTCAEGDGKWWLIGDVVDPNNPSPPYDPAQRAGDPR